MRKIEEIKNEYKGLTFRYNVISDEEVKEYKINEEMLKEWRTEFLVDRQNKFVSQVRKLNENTTKEDFLRLEFDFALALVNERTNEEAYENYVNILREAYENDFFVFYSFGDYSPLYENSGKEKVFFEDHFEFYVKRNPEEFYPNQKYGGFFPEMYYSGHTKVFDDCIRYFMNTIYPKYGKYIQFSMKGLVTFCREYKLPYVDELIECHRKAMEIDYPSHHKYKYQIMPQYQCEWKLIR